MSISVTCPSCDKSFSTADANAGKRGKCPQCEAPIMIPDLRVVEVEEESAPQDHAEPEVFEAPEQGFNPVAFAFGAGAAIAGAALWAAILYLANYQTGWAAWGIGGLVGFAVIAGNGRGIVMAAIAAVLAIGGIFGGKWIGHALWINEIVEQTVGESSQGADPRMIFDEIQRDSAAWNAQSKPVSDEDLAKFMLGNDFTEARSADQVQSEELEWFRNEAAPELEEFGAKSHTYDQWMDEWREDIRVAAGTPLDGLIEGLGGLDLLFVGLGLATAWGMVMKNTQAEVRAVSRAERSARGKARTGRSARTTRSRR